MPPFVHQPLLWGLLIVGVPVLIHLINMLRHRRVQWAAMEFLLASQKKHRTWIVLKQLLLLMMRMAAVAVIVLMVAGPRLHNQWTKLLGSTRTHHVLLLDDSFSMSDRWADTSAMDQAKAVVERIGTTAARQNRPQALTLLRFSRAARLDAGTLPDMLKEPVNQTGFLKLLEKTLKEIEPSETSAGPIQPLGAIGQLLRESGDERQIVYLISDFRAREWDDPVELKKQLAELNELEAEIHLVNCVDQARPNLAITSLAPAAGIQAAGVPFFMKVSVQNFGATTAREVSVLLEEDGHARPAVTIARIPPGKTVTERFLVHFPTAGQHQAIARLESDAVAVDNSRYGSLDLPTDLPVLVIDGSPEALDARYLSIASAPGGSVRTGIRPQIESPRFLSLKPLDEFAAINLVNVERLDQSAIEALERFVTAGGGVAVFLGERCRAGDINDKLYRDGEGFFPLPLAGEKDLLVDRLQRAPDVDVDEHFIFRVFQGKRDNLISTLMVQRYFAAPKGWKPQADSTTRVIARLRNGDPLVVERGFGEGRVVALLTSAAPVWNNWARNPSFVVAMQDLQAYLSRRRLDEVARVVGTPLELELDPAEYQPQVRFVTPADDTSPQATVEANPTPGGLLAASLPQTGRSGIYRAQLARNDGSVEVRRYALNVEAAEGDLEALGGTQLAARLGGVRYRYEQAAAFQYTAEELAESNLSDALLFLLIVLLIGEMILAFSAGYHQPLRRQVVPASGGVR